MVVVLGQFVQVLVLACVPLPQDTEHAPMAAHGEQLQEGGIVVGAVVVAAVVVVSQF